MPRSDCVARFRGWQGTTIDFQWQPGGRLVTESESVDRVEGGLEGKRTRICRMVQNF